MRVSHLSICSLSSGAHFFFSDKVLIGPCSHTLLIYFNEFVGVTLVALIRYQSMLVVGAGRVMVSVCTNEM